MKSASPEATTKLRAAHDRRAPNVKGAVRALRSTTTAQGQSSRGEKLR